MVNYKMTRKNLSKIRTSKEECAKLEKEGFVLSGEFDKDMKPIKAEKKEDKKEDKKTDKKDPKDA